jgi:hypothetical protein
MALDSASLSVRRSALEKLLYIFLSKLGRILYFHLFPFHCISFCSILNEQKCMDPPILLIFI